MPYALELRFDDALNERIARIWQVLAAMNLCPLPSGEAAPHVSLAVYDDGPGLEAARLAAALDRLAGDHAPLPVVFSSIGLFPGEERVLFLAPVVSRPLLDVHAAWHALAADLAASCRSYYLPGNWVPHCTLGTGVPTSGLAMAIEHLREHWTPLCGTLQALALIRTEPAQVVHQRPLSA